MWNNKIITYYFQNITNDFNQNQAKESVREAFRTWQAQARIYFIEVCNSSQADIVILFGSGAHGDNYPFDNQNGVLAHAFYPPPNSGSLAGDVHFDEDENWTNIFQNYGSQPIDLQTVALHEIGHSLGLAHSTVSDAIMYAYYGGSRRILAQDDIDGIRVIYGSPINVITGSNVICGSIAQTYSLAEAIPSGYSITWTANTSQVILNSSGTNVTVTNNGFNGNLVLTSTISNGCGTLVFTKEIQITNGSAPNIYSFTPYITQGSNTTYMSEFCNKLTYVCEGYNKNISENIKNNESNIFSPNSYCASGYITDPTATSITWSVAQTSSGSFHGYYIFNGNQFQVGINANYTSDWIILKCTRSNACGSSDSYYKFYVTGQCVCPGPPYCEILIDPFASEEKYTISPNPTNGQFNISLTSRDENAFIKEIIIKNKMGIAVFRKTFSNNQKQQTVNLFSKSTDIYFIEIFDGNEWTTQKLSLQR